MKTLNLAQLNVEELSTQEMTQTQGGSFLDFANLTVINDLLAIGTSLSIGGGSSNSGSGSGSGNSGGLLGGLF
nr:hypothetical protein [uncultured Arsenicibacter sp.]